MTAYFFFIPVTLWEGCWIVSICSTLGWRNCTLLIAGVIIRTVGICHGLSTSWCGRNRAVTSVSLHPMVKLHFPQCNSNAFSSTRSHTLSSSDRAAPLTGRGLASVPGVTAALTCQCGRVRWGPRVHAAETKWATRGQRAHVELALRTDAWTHTCFSLLFKS